MILRDGNWVKESKPADPAPQKKKRAGDGRHAGGGEEKCADRRLAQKL